MRRKCLGREGFADHDVLDRLVHDLLETGHVNPGLLRIQVHVALERGVVELLLAIGLDAYDLLDAGDPDAGQAHLRGRHAGLHVGRVDN